MNDQFAAPDALSVTPLDTDDVVLDSRGRLALYLAVGLAAGAVIALQIDIMRVFSVGSWAHFGSLVVSLAMLGFGLTSAVMCVAKNWFQRHWRGAAGVSLALLGPLAVAANLYVQKLGFNAIFLVSDPAQKWKLLQIFLVDLTPFLAGAVFLGCVFLKSNRTFGRVYFADLAGSGLCGLVFLGSMYLFRPENLIAAPLALWLAAMIAWALGPGGKRALAPFLILAIVAFGAHFVAPNFGLTLLAVNDYKGVAYARKFPDSKRVYESVSPFGYVEAYSSSYFHFAPGLSDNAAFNLPAVPANAYLAMYIDSDGPIGVIRNLPDKDTAYFRFLPMYYPYVIKKAPKVFVTQFGGGISTALALRSGAKEVTVAEGNRAVLAAFHDKVFTDFTGDILSRVNKVIDYEGRHFLAHTDEKFDIVDLSLADSTGLSSPGGFSVVEKFSYTREAMETYMRALADGGVLSVTLWNKEEPPKSILKLYATMASAAQRVDPAHIADSFFVVSSYLSTATVLYKRGGFTEDEVAKLRQHTKAMSFDEIYSPGFFYDGSQTDRTLDGYVAQIFSGAAGGPPAPTATTDATAGNDPNGPADPTGPSDEPGANGDNGVVPATVMGRLAWSSLINGEWPQIAKRYVFDTRILTNDQPYFAAYVKTKDLTRILDRLELLQDEWGYLLIWATLGVACLTAGVLLAIPVAWGWRAIFSMTPGKALTIVYFACLGAGYIMVEVGLIAHFVMALGNATVSASVLITGMLVFSGLGSLTSERILPRMRAVMPVIFLAIGGLLILYALFLNNALDAIGALPYGVRLLLSFAFIAPPAFLMGFPMPTAMTTLGRLGKDHMFIWAWGVNGCFSVIGAAAAPVIATNFGLGAVIEIAGCAYFLALPAFFGVISSGPKQRFA